MSKVLAKVGELTVTEAEVNEFILSLGQRGSAYNNPEGKRAVLNQLISNKLLLQDARRNLYEGEAKFRELETEILLQVGKQSGLVIATGGGVVTQERNYAPLHQNGTIFFIERKLKNLARDGRPLSMKVSAEEMYAARIDAYHRFADHTILSHENAEDTAERIISNFFAN